MRTAFSVIVASGLLIACSVTSDLPHEKLTTVYERYGNVSTVKVVEPFCKFTIVVADPLPATPTFTTQCTKDSACVEDVLVEHIRQLRLYAKTRNQQITDADLVYQNCLHK